MTKKAQVIALPYKEPEIVSPQEAGRYINVLTRHESVVTGFTWEYRRYTDGMIAQNPYHLYFTTDEEIKEGDWFITNFTNNIFQLDSLISTKHFAKDAKKVVASTNPDLWYREESRQFGSRANIHTERIDLVPKIGQDFLEAYVREQGDIKEVLLKYDEKYADLDENLRNIPYLKLRPNGTVIIHPVQPKLYTREEVYLLLQEFDGYASEVLGIPVPDGGSWFNEKYPQ